MLDWLRWGPSTWGLARAWNFRPEVIAAMRHERPYRWLWPFSRSVAGHTGGKVR